MSCQVVRVLPGIVGSLSGLMEPYLLTSLCFVFSLLLWCYFSIQASHLESKRSHLVTTTSLGTWTISKLHLTGYEPRFIWRKLARGLDFSGNLEEGCLSGGRGRSYPWGSARVRQSRGAAPIRTSVPRPWVLDPVDCTSFGNNGARVSSSNICRKQDHQAYAG